jgi:hypothetical protein
MSVSPRRLFLMQHPLMLRYRIDLQLTRCKCGDDTAGSLEIILKVVAVTRNETPGCRIAPKIGEAISPSGSAINSFFARPIEKKINPMTS